jgi:hypothetical protein
VSDRLQPVRPHSRIVAPRPASDTKNTGRSVPLPRQRRGFPPSS